MTRTFIQLNKTTYTTLTKQIYTLTQDHEQTNTHTRTHKDTTYHYVYSYIYTI